MSKTIADDASDSTTTLSELRREMQQFVEERDWQKFHNAKNLAMSLAIEVGELMEHFQWLTTDEVNHPAAINCDQVADEIADVACYLLSLVNALEIDLTTAIRSKMVKNRRKYPAATD